MTKDSSIICEIFDGLTPIKFEAELLYLRHISLKDQQNLSDSFERQKQKAILNTIPTEAEAIKKIKDAGLWTEKDELDVGEKKSYIETLYNTKKAYDLKSQREAVQKTIDGVTSELNALLLKKRDAICTVSPNGKTAEDYATCYSNEEFVRNILYSDRELRQLRYSEEEFAEIDDLSPLMKEYYSMCERISDEKIQELTLSDSFSLYLGHIDKPMDFFGRPLTFLSTFQLKLLAYGRMFLNILQNVENIPESIRKSPKELLDFVDSQRKRDKNQQKNSKHNNVGVVGGTKEDLEYYDPNAKKIDLAEEIKKNGGKLDANQMASLFK